MMNVMSEVPPVGRDALEPADDDTLNEMVHLARLEHRQVSEVVLKPASLSLSGRHESSGEEIGEPVLVAAVVDDRPGD